MIKAVLFDLDGTLIDTLHLYLQTYFKTMEHFPDVELLDMKQIEALKPTSEYRALEKLVGEELAEKAFNIFLDNYSQLHAELFQGAFPGVISMLEILREKGFLLGIVTGKSRPAWEITSAQVNLGEFDVVITDNEVIHPKPHPDGLVEAMRLLGIPLTEAQKVVYVGDSISDLLAAREAGVKFAAAVWSYWVKTHEFLSWLENERENFAILEVSADLIDYLDNEPVS